jgi:uncharacterized protein YlxW (UPF0749 family)
MNLLQIKHQLKNGQKQFTDKTVRVLVTEIERLQARERDLQLQITHYEIGAEEMFPLPDTEQP